MIVLLTALAGGLGAVLRFVTDSWIKHRWGARFPVGTTLINVTGSFGLGLLLGLSAHHRLAPDLLVVLGTGLLGGFTTMSTASVEVVRLLRLRARVTALAHLLGMAVLCVAAGALGWWLG